jgi:regulator of protease activity HflC (stomatin/prohibitin superfamily)
MVFLLVLIIIGVFVLSSMGVQMRKTGRERTAKTLLLLRNVGIGIAVAIIIFSSAIVIDPGEVGVQVLFGDVSESVLTNGLHFINPLMEIKRMDVRTQSYTMSSVHSEGQRVGDDAIATLSSDGLTIKLEVTILYHLNPESAQSVYRLIGLDYGEKVIRPEIRSAIRDIAVSFLSTDMYGSKREDFVTRVQKRLDSTFNKRGILLEQFLLRDVQLPDRVKAAIDEKIAAEQEAQKMTYVLQKEQKEAERKKVEAGGIAEAQRIISNSLNLFYLQWNYIQTLKELANSPNSTFVITPYDQKLTPMFNVPTPTGGVKK